MEPEQFARLIELLGLSAAEGETAVTPESALAKVEELVAQAGRVPELETAATDIESIRQQLDAKEAELRTKHEELEELWKKQREAEVDEILKTFAERIPTDEMRTVYRNLLLSDRDSATTLLNGLPMPAEKKTEQDPPEPVHNPGEDEEMSSDEKIATQNALISTIRKEVRGGKTPFGGYEAARDEARRRKPELFS